MAGIYIHIPFCKTKCPYCDFYSVERETNYDKYIEALLNEIEIRRKYIKEKVETIYFGGGTPSLLDVDAIEKILNTIQKIFGYTQETEITYECNPDDLTLAYVQSLKKIGINRISLGTQSFNDNELKFLGRRHRSIKNHEALDYVFTAGFRNVSIDLIYGLPGSTSESLEASLETAFRYPIRHVSAYHLTIEKNTRFYQLFLKGILKEISDEKSMNQFKLLVKMLTEKGFDQYEISNFAKSGYHSRHNSNYWKGIPYLGLGPSSHSYDGENREWNVADVDHYIELVTNGQMSSSKEHLSNTDQFNEYIMTGLRTMWGVKTNEIREKFGEKLTLYFSKKIKPYCDSGDITIDGDQYVLTQNGKFVSDYIIRDLIIVE